MTHSAPKLRALTFGALAIGLLVSACATEVDTDDAPLADVETEPVVAPADIPVGTYALDASHSELGFRVRHLGISNVDGTFNDFEGTIVVPETGLEGMTADLTAQAASIDTDNERRDGHLRSPDFFSAEEHPTVTFRTTRVEPLGGSRFRMTGDLTMRGTTRPVTLEGEYLGSAVSRGTQKIGFEAEGEIRRQDWGLDWAGTNDLGEAVVDDTVRLMISAEADRQDAPAETDEAAATEA
ncbi:MAG: YceI family protein [Rubricoccaceae bacterium]|nr:YceI family protein [Rubricoccaceae bacterium]